MSVRPFHKISTHRLLRSIMAILLVFAAWHVTQHEVPVTGNGDTHEECQVCRLGHTPSSDVDVAPSTLPLFLLQLVTLAVVLQLHNRFKHQTPLARGPPAL